MGTKLARTALLVLLAGGLCAQEAEVLREAWPNGNLRVEREVRRGPDGKPIDDGDYKSFHEDGTPASEGRCRDGKRVGTWRTWHPNGQLASKGVFRRGLRNQKWVYLDENGDKDGGESGDYRAVFESYPDGTPRSEGEHRFKRRHGRWTTWFPDGSLESRGTFRHDKRHGTWTWFWPEGGEKLQGAYVRGVREGPWVFHHPNGYADPDLVSGVYADGERVSPDPHPSGPELDPDSPYFDPAALPRPLPFPGLTAGDERALTRLLDDFLGGDEGRRMGALEELAPWGHAALALVIERLLGLDPSREEDELVGYRLHHVLLSEMLNGHVFEWRSGTEPEAVARNRRTILRWCTLWRLTRESEGFWDAVASVDPEQDPDLLLRPPLGDGGVPTGADASTGAPVEAAGSRAERARLLDRYGGRGTEEALALALRWLAHHQADVGAWDCDGFHRSCGSIGEGTCDGAGEAANDVGVTGLALLALQAGGSTETQGPFAENVASGVRYLLSRQDLRGGLIGPPGDHHRVYGHAMATLALCEASRHSRNPKLASAVQRAVDHILAIQNEGLAWRYDTLGGDNDTSVTAWMVGALSLAERSGYHVGRGAFEGALAWIDRVTDATTGRVGYDVVGTRSARTSSNQSFPRESGEALTAAALLCRFLAGQDPAEVPIMGLHAALLSKSLPVFRAGEPTNDLYHWYYGTYAMFQVGGKGWKRWNAAMKEAVLAAQATDGDERGSWDPIGPWGYAGGRIYSTALMALCLEVYHHHPRLLE